MGSISRLRVSWTGGGVIGGGVSTFYFAGADGANPGAVRSFFNASPLLFPASVTITVPNNGDVIENTTGDLVGTWTSGGALAPVSGTNTGDFAMGVGMRVRWLTAGIVAGRRVNGSTFLVPIASGIFDTDGTLDGATVTAEKTAADALVAAAPALCVWSRPTPSRAGSSHLVMSTQVPDKVSWLRSRRT